MKKPITISINLGWLLLISIILKLCNILTWSWIWILWPLWVIPALFILIIFIYFLVLLIAVIAKLLIK